MSELRDKRPGWGLFRRRECVVPTWRGVVLLFLLGVGLGAVAIRAAHPFLAITERVPSRVLIVEGWAADYVLEEAIAEFRRGQYRKVVVTGVPLERGAPLSEYQTFAEMGAATLVRLGLEASVVQPIPAPRVRQDRTFACAVAVRDWLRQHGAQEASLNVMTVGPHARRTRWLFQQAFGKNCKVGVIAVPHQEYDANRWWRSSVGFRAVTGELMAYAYARLPFRSSAVAED